MSRADPHPMLYPLADLPPEEMARQHSDKNMQMAYRILWDNTLSFLSKRPLVREHRAIFGDNDLLLAIAGVEVIGQGWLAYQDRGQEAPKMPIPEGGLTGVVAEDSYLEALQPSIEERPRGVRLDDLLNWLSDHRIASPATLSTILARMKGAGWIDWPAERNITLSEAGRALLVDAQRADLAITVEAVQTFRKLLDNLEDGSGNDLQQTGEEVFQTIGLHLKESIQWMRDIGIPDDVDAQETSVEIDTLPPIGGYPAGIDPERQLRPDAPERQSRMQRETVLHERWGARWPRLRHRDRVLCRLDEILREQGVKGDAERAAWCARTRFDVLLRWQVGLDADDDPISMNDLVLLGRP